MSENASHGLEKERGTSVRPVKEEVGQRGEGKVGRDPRVWQNANAIYDLCSQTFFQLKGSTR